ncbi:MAG: tryptophan 2,3-dioxygenase [Flavobacteriales bacterium]|nr:tryptophan 2,3-dioxygenase [Flavobacteriales bacterium]
MAFDPEVLERLKKLEDKYETMGQDIKSYLDGLLYADSTQYWNYIQLDTLLQLQVPKTDFPDEMVFITYHQITELYFRLTLHEMEQISNNGRDVRKTGEDRGWKSKLDADFFVERLSRINRYFDSLIQSFSVMVEGMEKDQFQRFRMALLPASGFQSVQYRKIEICATAFKNLVAVDKREEIADDASIEEIYENVYWKLGAVELASGKKTLTLKQFEKKYSEELIELAKSRANDNLWEKYQELSDQDKKNDNLINSLRQLDVNVNVNWPLVHYKSAVRYLHTDEKDVAATGGTNWQKYLPPKFPKRIFYPDLWSDEEKEDWGKKWVESALR